MSYKLRTASPVACLYERVFVRSLLSIRDGIYTSLTIRVRVNKETKLSNVVVFCRYMSTAKRFRSILTINFAVILFGTRHTVISYTIYFIRNIISQRHIVDALRNIR